MITPEQLSEWREACEKATPGPWKSGHYLGGAGEVYSIDAKGNRKVYVADCFAGPWNQDAPFIAAARVALPALLVEVTELQGELDANAALVADIEAVIAALEAENAKAHAALIEALIDLARWRAVGVGA